MNEIKKLFQQVPIQFILPIVTVVITLLNLWIAFKLSPLVQDLGSLTTRVSAAEEKIQTADANRTDVQVIKEQVFTIREDIKEVKVGANRMNDKLDRLLENNGRNNKAD